MVNRDLLFLAAFLFKSDQKPFSRREIILDLQIHDGADPRKGIGKTSKKALSRRPTMTDISTESRTFELPSVQTPAFCPRSAKISRS